MLMRLRRGTRRVAHQHREEKTLNTAELVKKLLDAGANSDAVAIAIQAVEEAADAATEAATPRRRRRRKPAEVVSVVR